MLNRSLLAAFALVLAMGSFVSPSGAEVAALTQVEPTEELEVRRPPLGPIR